MQYWIASSCFLTECSCRASTFLLLVAAPHPPHRHCYHHHHFGPYRYTYNGEKVGHCLKGMERLTVTYFLIIKYLLEILWIYFIYEENLRRRTKNHDTIFRKITKKQICIESKKLQCRNGERNPVFLFFFQEFYVNKASTWNING